MKVSYKWLSEYLDVTGYTAEELAEKYTRSGVEVDIVENRNLGVSGVVVGYVKTKEKHPDADKLNLCTVDAGQGEDLQIVCGAKNVDAGEKVPVALIGAQLPGGLKIKRAKLRGVESQGMICSARELGLNDKLLPKEIQEGILVLPENLEVGRSILDVLDLDDKVLELDLTPNRSDCLSMLGAAYEMGAILGKPVKEPDVEASLASRKGMTKAEETISVEITAREQCSHYAARLIEGVTISASPLWLKNRLMAAGIRPINNIVDVTNYVMLEYGQPLHAFDADQLTNGHLDVRLAREGETIVSLDDVERKLQPDMLVITDGTKPVAIAGVMGGTNSEVTEGTARILLESARFSGSSVRKTSRQLGLRSESSLRFEKEVNPEGVIPALNRAASLIAELSGGKIAEGIVETRVSEPEPVHIELSINKVNAYLGTELVKEDMNRVLDRLHFTYEESGADSVLVHVPSRRRDISRDVDLIEEVARLYGYDSIPTTLMSGVTTPGSLTDDQRIRRAIRNELTQTGLHEVITYTFTHLQQMNTLPVLFPDAKPVSLAMPMSEERSILRTSLLPQLLEVAAYNRNRNIEDVSIFEIGSAFVTGQEKVTDQPQEIVLLSMLMTGKRHGAHWREKAATVDFYDLKGAFERVTNYLGITGIEYCAEAPEGYHPGRTAGVYLHTGDGKRKIGRIGQLHPVLQKQKDLGDTYVLEVELTPLIEQAGFKIAYKLLPKYPAISRDIAVVVSTEVPVADMQQVIRQTAGDLLEELTVFDVYTGVHVGEGKKSIAFSLIYRHPERTLQDNEVTELHGRVVNALEASFHAELRK